MRDLYTHTEADAGAWDRNHLEASDFSDAPTRAEAEADAYHDGPDTVIGYGIKCAHCKGRHETVADVHWCSDLHAEHRAQAEAEQAWEAASDRAFARDREAKAEAGTWMGSRTEADEWDEPPF
jgi:hypothetical protein